MATTRYTKADGSLTMVIVLTGAHRRLHLSAACKQSYASSMTVLGTSNWRLECNQKGDEKAALQQPHGNGHGLSLPLSKTFLVENPARYTFAARIVAPPLCLPPNSSPTQYLHL